MNCKPGDMAEIVKVGSGAESNIGTIVTVVAYSHNHPLLGCVWQVKPAWPICQYATTSIQRDVFSAKVAICADASLRPIRPEEDPESILREEELTV